MAKYTDYIYGWKPAMHHRIWIMLLEAIERQKIHNLMIVAPPGFAKSTYTSIAFPTWYLANHPTQSLISITSSDDLATDFNTVVKMTFEDSPAFQKLAPHVRPDLKRSWSLNGLCLNQTPLGQKEAAYRSRGFNAHIIGIRTNGIILDDPLTQQESRSKTEMANATSTIDGTIDSRQRPDTYWTVAINTRWSEIDLASHFAKQNGWQFIHMPAILENGDKVREWIEVLSQVYNGEDISDIVRKIWDHYGSRDFPCSLWPEYFSLEFLLEKRAKNPVEFQCLYQGDPTALGGNIFNASYFKPCSAEEIKKLLPTMVVFQYWDTAFSESEIANYSACVTIGVTSDADIYILNAFHKRLSTADLVRYIVEQANNWRPIAVTIEEPAYRQELVKDVVKRVQRATMTSVFSEPQRGKKITNALLPALKAESGKVYVNKDEGWWPDFIMELIAFDRGANDDFVDAFSGVVAMADKRLSFDIPKETPYSFTLGDKHKKPEHDWLGPDTGIYIKPQWE